MIINSHSKHRKEEKLVAQDHKRKKWKTEIIFSVAANLSLDRYLLTFCSYIWIEQLLCSSSQCVSVFFDVLLLPIRHIHIFKREKIIKIYTRCIQFQWNCMEYALRFRCRSFWNTKQGGKEETTSIKWESVNAIEKQYIQYTVTK